MVLGVPVDDLGEVTVGEPDDEARQSFELAFGVTTTQQRNIEDWLLRVGVVTTGTALEEITDVYRFIFE